MTGVLFVCMGNICRSPMAEGVFRKLALDAGISESPRTGLIIDSAGTTGYHAGDAPDPRGRAVAARHQIDMSGFRARRVECHDFDHFDMVLGMDTENLRNMAKICPPGREERMKRFLDFAPGIPFADLPDPYYGDEQDFERCYELVHEAATGLLEHVINEFFPELK